MEKKDNLIRKIVAFLFKPAVLVVLLLVIGTGGVYSYVRYTQISDELLMLKGGSSELSKKETTALIKKVSALTLLPEGEDPTVMTVTDVDSLKDNKFFNYAQNGDKVLIYTNAKRAFLYRPDANKLIEIAPLNSEANEKTAETIQNAGEVASAEKKITDLDIVILNGTAAQDLPADVYNKLTENLTDYYFNLNDTSVAAKSYQKTMVVPLNEDFGSLAQSISTLLGAEISELPTEEGNIGSDIVIILGDDYIKQ